MARVRANFVVYDEPGNLMNPYIDVTTYQAAGERLNAGHDLNRDNLADFLCAVPGVLESAGGIDPPMKTCSMTGRALTAVAPSRESSTGTGRQPSGSCPSSRMMRSNSRRTWSR